MMINDSKLFFNEQRKILDLEIQKLSKYNNGI